MSPDGSRVESPQSVRCVRHASSLCSIVWGVGHSMQTSDWKNLVGWSHSDRRQVLLRHLWGRPRRPPRRLRWWRRTGDNNRSLTHDSRVAHPQLASKHLSVPEVGSVWREGSGSSIWRHDPDGGGQTPSQPSPPCVFYSPAGRKGSKSS